MTSVLTSNNFPLIADDEGYNNSHYLEETGMIRVDPLPTRRSAYLTHASSYEYGSNKHADIILHIPSVSTLQCASYDTSGQCRRKSIGFTRMSIMSTNSSFLSIDGSAFDISMEPSIMASTIKRVSSPTDFNETHSSKNPRDLLKTRMKSAKLTPEDIIRHTSSTDEIMSEDKSNNNSPGLDVESDQASICSTVAPCNKGHMASDIGVAAMTKLSFNNIHNNANHLISPRSTIHTSALTQQLAPLRIDSSNNQQPFSSHRTKACSTSSTPTAFSQVVPLSQANVQLSSSSFSEVHTPRQRMNSGDFSNNNNSIPTSCSKVLSVRTTIAATRNSFSTGLEPINTHQNNNSNYSLPSVAHSPSNHLRQSSQSQLLQPQLSSSTMQLSTNLLSPSSANVMSSVFSHSQPLLSLIDQHSTLSPRITPRRKSSLSKGNYSGSISGNTTPRVAQLPKL